MTTEQKARAYDEALQRARELNSGKDIDVEAGTTFCEYIFPELKENNEERIKNALITLLKFRLKDNSAIAPGLNVTKEEALEWLEKQKDVNSIERVFRPMAGDTIEKAAEQAVKLDGKVVLAFNGAYIPVGNKTKDEIVAEYRNWLDKQGEKKPYGQRKECED